MPVRHVLHLCFGNGFLVASGCSIVSDNYWYHLRAHRAGDGAEVWHKDLDSGFRANDKNHGKQDKHPMIIGKAVYLKQGNFDLATGKPLGFRFATSNCAECSASNKHIFGRNNNVSSVWSLAGDGSSKPLNPHMRPGCYVTAIGAGGVILSPPFSAGCTCSHSTQTTIAWLPK